MKSGDAPGEAGAQVLRGSQVYKVSPWANRAKSGERRSAAWTQPLLPSLAKLHCDLGPHRRVWNAEAPDLWCQDAALGAGAHTGKGDLHSPSTDLVPSTVSPTIPQARLCPLQPRPTTPVFRHMDAGGRESFCTKYQSFDHSFTSSALPASACSFIRSILLH